jgi:hypothetical protein
MIHSMEDQLPSDADELDELDEEDASSEIGVTEPWDPKQIRITTKHFSLRDVVDQIEDDEIDLAPEFQRDYVWKQRQKTRLIESILLGIPLPAFYFNQTQLGTYQVVDGVQRLSTISAFMRNTHVLTAGDLEYLQDLDGATYESLDAAVLRRFRSTQIVVHVIEPQTPDDVKFEIFNRVNTLGSPLSPQEIRHAMGKERSRKFLNDLVSSKYFDAATEQYFWKKNDGQLTRNSRRMTDRELALRYCAFFDFSIDDYRKHPSLDRFLIAFMKKVDDPSHTGYLSDSELNQLTHSFENSMNIAHSLLGKAAFRRWPVDAQRRGPINRAVFEAQAIAFAPYSLDDLLPHKDRIAEKLRLAFDDSEYLQAVTVSTGTVTRISHRLGETRRIIEAILA